MYVKRIKNYKDLMCQTDVQKSLTVFKVCFHKAVYIAFFLGTYFPVHVNFRYNKLYKSHFDKRLYT